MEYSYVLPSSFILIIMTLAMPLTDPKSTLFHVKAKTSIKLAFFISISPLLLFLNYGLISLSVSWNWTYILTSSLNLSLQLDMFSAIFTPTALFVAWNIAQFSTWYMQNDPKIHLFFKYILTFLLAMIVLVSAGNMIILFIGWEGVGIMSYLLIGWYFTRSNAGAAALQAVLYNRIGDIGFLYAMFWLISSSDSMDFNLIFSMNSSTPFLAALIIAAASKSAQFGFHPWLASAMEGPTPVSALLHSSTMVVAGVFLLIRMHPLLTQNQNAMSFCLCLGATSTAFAAACALSQNDIKKIIAYSTSSQLGLMMVAIGLNLPHLALFHISTHALFKAMLFLCSGSIIHTLGDQQDIRKMGGLQKILPTTTSCLSIGGLALMGTPYLAGFFSKDAIIEATNTSNINALALTMVIIATSLTAVYSLRIIFYASMKQPMALTPIFTTETSLQTKPIINLAIGTIMAGLLISQTIFPSSPTTLTMPMYMKITAPIISLLGFAIAFGLALSSWASPLTPKPKAFDSSVYHSVTHFLIPNLYLNFSMKTSSHLIDSVWMEKLGPKGMSKMQLPPALMIQQVQRGLIKTYLSVFTISSILSITLLHFV